MKSKRNFIQDYSRGFASLFSAFGFVSRNKSLLAYFIIPFILNVAILVSLIYLSINYLHPFLAALIPAGDEWYWTALRFALKPFVIVFTVAIDLVVYSITGAILCAPLLDFLSEKVEKIVNGKLPFPDQPLLHMIFDLLRVAVNAMALVAFILTLNIVIILLNLIPVLGNGLYFVINILAVNFIFGFQFFDFALERRKKKFAEKLNFASDNKWILAGLGGGFMLISFIPVIGFLGLVAGTIAGTRLYLDMEKE